MSSTSATAVSPSPRSGCRTAVAAALAAGICTAGAIAATPAVTP